MKLRRPKEKIRPETTQSQQLRFRLWIITIMVQLPSRQLNQLCLPRCHRCQMSAQNRWKHNSTNSTRWTTPRWTIWSTWWRATPPWWRLTLRDRQAQRWLMSSSRAPWTWWTLKWWDRLKLWWMRIQTWSAKPKNVWVPSQRQQAQPCLHSSLLRQLQSQKDQALRQTQLLRKSRIWASALLSPNSNHRQLRRLLCQEWQECKACQECHLTWVIWEIWWTTRWSRRWWTILRWWRWPSKWWALWVGELVAVCLTLPKCKKWCRTHPWARCSTTLNSSKTRSTCLSHLWLDPRSSKWLLKWISHLKIW